MAGNCRTADKPVIVDLIIRETIEKGSRNKQHHDDRVGEQFIVALWIFEASFAMVVVLRS